MVTALHQKNLEKNLRNGDDGPSQPEIMESDSLFED